MGGWLFRQKLNACRPVTAKFLGATGRVVWEGSQHSKEACSHDVWYKLVVHRAVDMCVLGLHLCAHKHTVAQTILHMQCVYNHSMCTHSTITPSATVYSSVNRLYTT